MTSQVTSHPLFKMAQQLNHLDSVFSKRELMINGEKYTLSVVQLAKAFFLDSKYVKDIEEPKLIKTLESRVTLINQYGLDLVKARCSPQLFSQVARKYQLYGHELRGNIAPIKIDYKEYYLITVKNVPRLIEVDRQISDLVYRVHCLFTQAEWILLFVKPHKGESLQAALQREYNSASVVYDVDKGGLIESPDCYFTLDSPDSVMSAILYPIYQELLAKVMDKFSLNTKESIAKSLILDLIQLCNDNLVHLAISPETILVSKNGNAAIIKQDKIGKVGESLPVADTIIYGSSFEIADIPLGDSKEIRDKLFAHMILQMGQVLSHLLLGDSEEREFHELKRALREKKYSEAIIRYIPKMTNSDVQSRISIKELSKAFDRAH
ncbi:hypothetical protein N9Y92_03005 [Chlamydiales bacterium]|nr:hypothetical protein [Chlamydiales bacterium]